MPDRNILTITPFSMLWYEEGNNIIIQHFFTKRKVLLEEEEYKLLWKLLFKNSNYSEIRKEYLKYFDEKEFDNSIKTFLKLGLIKIFRI